MSYLKRYDAKTDMTADDLDAIRALVRSLGHADADNIAATFAITADPIGVQLHLSEHLRDETGFKVYDVAADHIATRPHVHEIDPEQLPAAIRPPAKGSTDGR